MADILEFAKKDSTFTVAEVLEDKLSSLLARMHDYMALRQSEEEKAIIQSWRNDIVAIRRVIYNTRAANTACTGRDATDAVEGKEEWASRQ